MHDDLRGVLDALLAITISEALAKPIARRFGRWILAHADRHWHWIPDWLHTSPPDS